MKLKHIFFFALIINYNSSIAQRGKQGNLTVNSNQIINEYTTLVADANEGDQQILVANAGLNQNNRFPNSLSPGDLIMIIQMQGATIQSDNIFVDTWGTITAYNNSGNHELLEVRSVNGNEIHLFCALKSAYSVSGKTQIIRVPRLSNLTVASGGTVNGQAWNGNTGGVIAIETDGDLEIQTGGKIEASGIGFRGGLANENNSFFGGTRFADVNSGEGAEKGESIAGDWAVYDQNGGRYCKGAPANGGGGGTSHNAGGGGGANASNNPYNGLGNPSNSNTNWTTAWNLEAPGFANNTSSGGGRGGYSFSGVNQNPLTLGPNTSVWGGDWRRIEGGRGGRALEVSINKIFMGGGGGAGDQNDNLGGDGGNGGGIIYINCYGTISGSGEINTNGNNGQNSQGSGIFSGVDGSGGAGGGGAIVLRSINPIGNLQINARGGNGGNQVMTPFNNTQAQGPGGGGSGGIIYHTGGTFTSNLSGGMNGTTNSASLSSFPPNGATMGGAGTVSSAEALFDINLIVQVACIGQDVYVQTEISGITNVDSISIVYYDSDFNFLSEGNQYLISEIAGEVNLYVTTCKGNNLKAIQVIPESAPEFTIGSDLSICVGDSVTLQSDNTFENYQWEPVEGLSSPSAQSTLAAPSETQIYTLSIMGQNGCIGKDSILISVNENPELTVTAPNEACIGTEIQLEASGANEYVWTGTENLSDDTIENPVLTVLEDENITVTGKNIEGCEVSIELFIQANDVAQVSVSEDQAICGDDVALLSASGAVSYSWSPTVGLENPNEAETIAAPTESTSYFVNFIDANNCEGQAGPVQVIVGEEIEASFTFEQIDNYNVNFINTTEGENEATWLILGNILEGDEVTYNFPFDGFFAITLIVNNECGNDTIISQLEIIKLNVENIPSLGEVKFFPNPFRELLNIEFELNKPEHMQIQLLDISGRVIQSKQNRFYEGKHLITFETNQLASGFYFIRLQNESFSNTFKISTTR